MIALLLATALLAALPTSSLAQPGPWTRGPAGAGPGFGEAGPRMHLLLLWRLIDRLQVDEAQAARLIPLWSRHQRERWQLQQERQQAADQLALLLEDGDADDDAILSQMEEVEAADEKAAAGEARFRSEMAEVLTPRQRARLLLFPEQFRGELRGLLSGRGAGGRAPFGPWGHRAGSDSGDGPAE